MSDYTGDGYGPNAGQRLAAWVALIAAAAAVVFLATQAVRRWDVLLVSVASLAVLVGAAWIALSRRGLRRAAAAACAIASLAVLGVVVLASESLRVLLVALALAVLMVAAARVALSADGGPGDAPEPKPGARPQHPVLIMNLKSGGGKADRFEPSNVAGSGASSPSS